MNLFDITISGCQKHFHQNELLSTPWFLLLFYQNQEQKENMSLFVNHGFLDKISIYIGQLTVASSNDTSPELNAVYKNIESVLVLIKAEQKFGLHSFY